MGSASGSSSNGSSGGNTSIGRGDPRAAAALRGPASGPGPGLGLTTGKTIHGNTAFGPAGGMATGYATRSNAPNVSGGSADFGRPGSITGGTFSNFRNTDGSAMFGGGLQNQGVRANNALQALGMLRAMQAGMLRPTPAGGPMTQPGLLDDELPTDAIPERPTIPPNIIGPWPGQNTARFLQSWHPSMWMRNPTQRPYDARNSPPRAYFTGTYPTGKGPFGGSSAAMPPGKGDFNNGKGDYQGAAGMPRPDGSARITRR